MPLKWMYRMFRPRNAEEAATAKLRFSIVYAFIGWNLAGVVMYLLYRENIPGDKDEQKQVLLTKLSKNQDVRYIRVNQLSVVEDKIIPQTGDTSELKQEEDA